MKRKTARSEKYLDFVRSCASVVSGSTRNVVAHHVRLDGGGGMGIKPSDFRTLPLTNLEHATLHAIGERRYWANHGIEPWEQVAAHMIVYGRDRTPLDFKAIASLDGLELVDYLEAAILRPLD